MRKPQKSTACLTTTAAALALTMPVVAQDVLIEEILVTAAKREQTLQEIPVAVTVVSDDIIEQAQILDVKDLQSVVPSLRVSQLQVAGNTSFFIRGFGNGSNNVGTEPSVGVFVDGVYRSRSASALSDYPNLERIEVLRGPQSTLFGKNASAGVISVVTAKPDLDAVSGSLSFTSANYDQFLLRADVTGPISDTLAFSLSGSINARDGYFTNLNDGSDIGTLDRQGVRGQLLWVPTDALEFRLIADYDQIDEECCGTVNVQDGPSSGIIQAIGGNVLTEMPFDRAQFYNYNPTNDISNGGVSLQIDYDFANMTLTSITSSRDLSRTDDADSDFTSARLLDQVLAENDIDTFTQEFRLTSSGDGAFDWMVGGFFFDEDLIINNNLVVGPDFRPYGDFVTGGVPPLGVPSGLDDVEDQFGLPRGTFFAPGSGNVEVMTQDNKAISIFGQVDLYLGDRTTITLGANYTEDEKDVAINIATTEVFSSLDFEQIVYSQTFATIAGVPPTPANIAALPVVDATAAAISTTNCDPTMPALPCNPLLPLQDFQFLPPFLGFPNGVESSSTRDDDTTWTARIAYDLTDDINIYAGAATGFKASSWNLTRDSRPFPSDMAALGAGPNDRFGPPNLVAGTRYAGPEEAFAVEVGMKGRFERGTINVAIFDQEIEGFQSAIFVGTGFVLANAGKQSTTGIELEANYAPTDNINLAFAGTWLDPVYDDFQGAEGPNGPTDLSGQKVAGVSEFSMNLSGIYNFEFGSTGSGFIRAEYIFDDEVQVVENVPADVLSREVSMFNASIGFMWENGFEAMLWGRNLNNDDYLTSGFPTTVQFDRISAYPNQPRTYGVTLTKRFN